ncbi:MAG: folylpolyglutamate synthase/dihydrofolate synthase family protein [Candidatus Omnitrophota bacterium]
MESKYKSAVNYLESFVNYERKNITSYQKEIKLERVKRLLKELDISYEKLKVIHIAGTKGKGSTAGYCAFLLSALGYKVGLFTSPHFFDVRERIVIKKPVTSNQKPEKEMIAKRDLARIVDEFKPKIKRFSRLSKFGKPTFFEVYTAVAFKYFLEQNADYTVLETGMGGRLDATNVTKPLLCILTHIGYDHTHILGKKISQIASEKAGIFKPGVFAVSAPQEKSASGIIIKKAKENNINVQFLNRDFSVCNIRIKSNYTVFDAQLPGILLKNVKVSLKGKEQIDNSALALAGISLIEPLKLAQNKHKALKALRNTSIAGRFEQVSKNPLIVVDTAHNPSSFTVLAESLRIYYPFKKIILIFAASSDKDIKNMLPKINYSHIILTSFSSPRSLNPLQAARICRLKDALYAENIKEAFQSAKGLYKKDSLILVSGSFFLVAEAMRLLKTK